MIFSCGILPSQNLSVELIPGDVLEKSGFSQYADKFNKYDKETIKNDIENKDAWNWLEKNIPFFECPDKEIEEIYYFRWWVYRKHIKQTPSGYVITEFLPKVGHSKKYNTIVCAAGFHIEEGRWLRDPDYIRDYSNFWFRGEGELSDYSNWLIPAIWDYCKTTGDKQFAEDLLPEFVAYYKSRENQNIHESGLFWSGDSKDGGEYSISGNGLRPTLNSYMYGTAKTIAEIATFANLPLVAREYEQKAGELKRLVEEKLWDNSDQFFKTVHLQKKESSVEEWNFDSMPDEHNVREIYGFIPWKFFLPGNEFSNAWKQILDNNGFKAPFGLTTAEQRHPRFMKYRVKRCQWDGPVWPFTTSLALKALANFIKGYKQKIVTAKDYLYNFGTYAKSQYRISSYGEKLPWIDENIHPYSGIWLARSIIFELADPVVGKDLNHGFERGKDYNHSSFADLLINDLIGLKARTDDFIEINPMLTNNYWDWFCIENILYHGRNLTILYDKKGTKYARGKGFLVFIDGKLAARSDRIQRMILKME